MNSNLNANIKTSDKVKSGGKLSENALKIGAAETKYKLAKFGGKINAAPRKTIAQGY